MPRALKAVGAGIRTGWLILGITLLLVILCEVGLRLTLSLKDRLQGRLLPAERQMVMLRAEAEAYHGVDWVSAYLEELEASYRFGWQPYVYWRRPPYQGRYINVDHNGLRATWTPPPRADAGDLPPVRVFTFGASTMWGYGVRDDYTIPSYLNKLLHERGYRAQVTNYGESAYVNTQEVITLLRSIQRDEVPDIVLFYDGINDTFSSLQNSEAGVPQNEVLRRAEFRLTFKPWERFRMLLSENFRGLDRFLTALKHRITNTGPDTRQQARSRSDADALARQTVQAYASNLAFVESLGRRYGFEPLFYWQPVVFSKQHRSPDEQAIFESLPGIEKWYGDVYRQVRQSQALKENLRFHDISGLFNALEKPAEPYYLDATHLSEPGNRVIAAAMVDHVIELIERHRATGSDNGLR